MKIPTCPHCGRTPVGVDDRGLIELHRRADWDAQRNSKNRQHEYCLRFGYRPETGCAHTYINHHCAGRL